MKNFTKNIIGLLVIVFTTSFIIKAQNNYSLSFDGTTDDYINLGDILNITEFPISFQLTFQIDSFILGGQVLFSSDNNVNGIDSYSGIWMNFDESSIGFSYGDNTGGTGINDRRSLYSPDEMEPLLINRWYNVTGVIRGPQDMSLYIDGVDNGGYYNGNGGEIACTSNPFLIAKHNIPNNGHDTFNGSILDFSFWTKELSIDEIQAYMSCSPSGDEEGLVGFWDFNEGSGDTVYDLSSNGNHGIIYGATYSEDVPEQNCSSSDEPSIIDQLNQSFDAWNITIDLSAGWNMFGYGCPSSIDLAQGLSSHADLIAIVKDNNGNVFMPEFGFNGIGNLTPGFGYQIKLSEAINSFRLCNWYVNDIPVDDIISLQEENVQLNNTNLDYQEVISQQQDSLNYINSLIGCKDNNACNFSILYYRWLNNKFIG